MPTELISADGHAVEPEDLWVERLSPRWRDVAPRVQLEDGGKVLTVLGQRRNIPALNIDHPVNYPWLADPIERAERLRAEGINGEVLYPQWAMLLYGIDDPDLQTEVLRAYNEWMAEFSAAVPGHYVGVGLLPIHDMTAAIEEIEHVKALGLRGLNIPSKRSDLRYNSSFFDPLWPAIEASGLPLSLHVAPTIEHRGRGAVAANITMNLGPFRNIFPIFVFSGILDRHPELKLVLTEGGIGWIAPTLLDMDMVYERYFDHLDPKLETKPSEIWRRQCFATFQEDVAGLRLLDLIGSQTVLWGADFPHPEGTYPHTQEILERLSAGLMPGDADAVFGGNARRLWLSDLAHDV